MKTFVHPQSARVKDGLDVFGVREIVFGFTRCLVLLSSLFDDCRAEYSSEYKQQCNPHRNTIHV